MNSRTETSTLNIELCIWTAIIAVVNMPLFSGVFPQHFHFLPDAIAAGEWWRLFTHPFVHASVYHLALDAGAFLCLYSCLRRRRLRDRLILVLVCGLSSLLVSMAVSEAIWTRGLCGLSGTAHGLMAALALDMATEGGSRSHARLAGWAVFSMVVAKSIFETVTGTVIFTSLHFGDVGMPIAVCHAGGVFGGILATIASRCRVRPARELTHSRQDRTAVLSERNTLCFRI
jgi:rhomboid family GlyGly-CTERM serine protease